MFCVWHEDRPRAVYTAYWLAAEFAKTLGECRIEWIDPTKRQGTQEAIQNALSVPTLRDRSVTT